MPMVYQAAVTAARFNFRYLFGGIIVVGVVLYIMSLKARKQIQAEAIKENKRQTEMENASLLIIDAQNDFIEGSMACANAMDAVDGILKYMEKNPELKAFYSADCHPAEHTSFKENGGIWPTHCVEGTDGAEIFLAFNHAPTVFQRPNEDNVFYKGRDAKTEEYSAFAAVNQAGTLLHEVLRSHVILAGFASEYCIKETALTLVEAGYKVELLVDGTGYVDRDEHIETILDLENQGVNLIG